MNTEGAVDRFVAVLAALACIVFVLGLVDTPVRPVTTSPEMSLPAGAVRDAELSVSAVDSRGRPLGGVLFTAFWKRGDGYFWAGKRHANPAGKAHFSALPRGQLWLLATKNGYARTSTLLVLAGEPREARVQLGQGHALSVLVRDESGTALAAATVLVDDSDPLPHGELTDSAGAARIQQLGPPPWRLRVSARGFETQRLAASADVSVVLRRLGSLAVHVVDSGGASVSGATVVIAGARLWPTRKTATGNTGIASITGLLGGSYDLRAFKGGLVSQTLFGFSLADGSADEVTLTLHNGRLVRVKVVDGEGSAAAPVAGADVVLVEGGVGSFPLRGRTDQRGRVELGPIAPGPAELRARADGFVARSGMAVPVDSAEEVSIALLRGAIVVGNVVDADGYPVGGASIEVIGSDLFGLPIAESPLLMNFSRAHFAWSLAGPVALVPAGELGVMPGPVPPIPGLGTFFSQGENTPAPGQALAPVEPWVTHANGEFTASPVTPGRVQVLVRHPDFVETLSDVIPLEAGGRASVRVELFRGGLLSGRVKDDSDYPVADANVELQALKGTFERRALTASDGSFAFAAVPKQVVISVARANEPGRTVLREHLEVTEGERTEIALSLPKPRANVEILVVDETDAAISLAQVSVASLDPNAPRRETLFTDEHGRVSVTDLAGLPLEVAVDAMQAAPRRVQVESAPESMLIVLRAGVMLSGSVTAVRGRFPVAAAQVTLLSGGQRRLARTDELGQYRFDHVPLGPARVSVEHPEHAPRSKGVMVADTGRADRPLEIEPIDLAEPGSVAGTVVNARGEPVRGARVTVGFVPAYLPLGVLPAGVVSTDEAGEFLLEGLPPGALELGAYAPGQGRASVKNVVVDSGRTTTEVVIRLRASVEEEAPIARGSLALTFGERGSEDNLDVVIVSVAASSEAERAGLIAGDRVRTIEGREPRDMLEARALLEGPVGSHVVLEITRGAQRHLLTAVREEVRR